MSKLSTILGGSSGGSGGSGTASYVASSQLPLLDYKIIRSSAYNTANGGNSGWDQYARKITYQGVINKATKNQFGVNFLCQNDQQQNQINHVVIPFQSDDNGAITIGNANTVKNSSGTSISTTFIGNGFNNTSQSNQGAGQVAAQTATFICYGRMYWSGSYQMMSWGGTIGSSNTVTTHGRNDYSDYNSSYPHPNNGLFGKTGGGASTPYYNIVGYDGNSYNYWSGWYYNNGSYPSHWTNNQLATYSSTSGFHQSMLAHDSNWDEAGIYKYYYTSDQFGIGNVTKSGNQSNQDNDLENFWSAQNNPVYENGTQWNVMMWRMAEDLCIVLDFRTWMFYQWNPTSNSFGTKYYISMDDLKTQGGWLDQFAYSDGGNAFGSNTGSWREKNRRPWKEPTVVGSVYTLDEMIQTENGRGFAIRRVKYDSSNQSLTTKIIYQQTNDDGIGYEFVQGGYNPQYASWSTAGPNKEILITCQYHSSQPGYWVVRTYDATAINTAIENAE